MADTTVQFDNQTLGSTLVYLVDQALCDAQPFRFKRFVEADGTENLYAERHYLRLALDAAWEQISGPTTAVGTLWRQLLTDQVNLGFPGTSLGAIQVQAVKGDSPRLVQIGRGSNQPGQRLVVKSKKAFLYTDATFQSYTDYFDPLT